MPGILVHSVVLSAHPIYPAVGWLTLSLVVQSSPSMCLHPRSWYGSQYPGTVSWALWTPGSDGKSVKDSILK